MGLMRTVAVGACFVGLGITYGGAKAFVDSKAGPGTFDQSVRYGSHSAAETAGEIAAVPSDVVEQVKPGLTNLVHQGTGALSSATGGGSWDQQVDPSTQQTTPGVAP